MPAQPRLRVKDQGATRNPLIKAMLRRNKLQTGSVSAFLLVALHLNNFMCVLNAAPVTDQCRLGKEKCAALLGDGGWATDYDPGLYTSRCNIPKVDLEAPVSADDFRAQFEHQAVRSLTTNHLRSKWSKRGWRPPCPSRLSPWWPVPHY